MYQEKKIIKNLFFNYDFFRRLQDEKNCIVYNKISDDDNSYDNSMNDVNDCNIYDTTNVGGNGIVKNNSYCDSSDDDNNKK
jgi:hypothetical protein